MWNLEFGRARMYLGALLLFATVVTWGTSFMMSPHGQTVVEGTQHLRSTIVTFKRNAAIGTLISCALAAWLLFPMRRPRWPARDWALIGLLAFLSGSSIYTLIWLPASAGKSASTAEFPANGAAANLNGGEPLPELGQTASQPAPTFGSNAPAAWPTTVPPLAGLNGRVGSRDQGGSAADGVNEPASSENRDSSSGEDEPDDNEVVGNQE